MTADQVYWAFLWWIKHNRHLSIEAMTGDDLDALAVSFAVENTGDLSAADHGTYTGTTFPKENTVAGSGITAAQTQAACDQSFYPKSHHSGG